MRLFTQPRLALALLLAVPAVIPASAQFSAPPNTANSFKDTSFVKPPAGARVAIFEFEDLECPACARAYPVVHAAIDKYKIPLIRHDYPLQMHVWSRDAALYARYLQDTVDPKLAEEYRRSVFAAQTSIGSKSDLQKFTQKFFQTHGKPMPFVVDPQGKYAAEIQADVNLGNRLGLSQTPTIFVATNTQWVQVTDPNYLYQTIDTLLAQTPATSATTAQSQAPNSKLKHPTTPQK
jgi:protein-disulfide isomerase